MPESEELGNEATTSPLPEEGLEGGGSRNASLDNLTPQEDVLPSPRIGRGAGGEGFPTTTPQPLLGKEGGRGSIAAPVALAEPAPPSLRGKGAGGLGSFAVIGAARTGVAVARALVPLGASVHVFDSKREEVLPEAAAALKAAGAEVSWGANDGPELRSADVIVPSPGVRKTSPVLLEAVGRGQTIWSEPELAFRLARGPLLAVTGTNGKTTTAALLAAILTDAGIAAEVGGNIAPGTPLVTLAADSPEGTVLVAEISSFQLEWIDTFRPKIGILTNLSPDHMDRHASMEEYAAAKARLFENQTPNEHTIVNADNPPALAIGEQSRGTLWTFSRQGPVERGAYIRCHQMVIRDGDGETVIGDVRDFKLPGGHNQENAMAAAIAAKIMGADADNLMHTLTRFAGVEHRMETVGVVDSVTYVNNSMCTNPAALVGSLEAYERPVVLIAGGLNKGLDFSAVPPVLAVRTKAVITIGQFGPELAAMARAAGVKDVVEVGTLAQAVPAARALAGPNDTVILAPGCASFGQFQDFQDRGNQFKALVQGMELTTKTQRHKERTILEPKLWGT